MQPTGVHVARQGDLTSLSSLSVALCRECGGRGQRQGSIAPRESTGMRRQTRVQMQRKAAKGRMQQ